MLNPAISFYGKDQLEKLKKSQSKNIVPNVYEYHATPLFYWQTPLLE
jgi:hypothetical protein